MFTRLMDKMSEMTLQQNREFKDFASDVARGLVSKRKNVSPKYLYDKIGSQLFEQICLQPEYYLTRTESSILDTYAHSISKLVGSRVNIIELGSGSSFKTAILLNYFSSQRKGIRYFPVDISNSILRESIGRLQSQFPNLTITEIASDYNRGIHMAVDECISDEKKNIQHTKLVLFLGSSIGNFEPAEASSLLRIVREKLHETDFLLVGFDLQKDLSVLNAAYNDSAGITAKFNLNLLARMNRELGGNFELGKFQHFAFYNREQQRIEMHLVSKTDQQVYIDALGQTFDFRKDESIHTENSYKYSFDQITSIAEDSGFRVEQNYTDKKRWFNLALLSPSSTPSSSSSLPSSHS